MTHARRLFVALPLAVASSGLMAGAALAAPTPPFVTPPATYPGTTTINFGSHPVDSKTTQHVTVNKGGGTSSTTVKVIDGLSFYKVSNNNCSLNNATCEFDLKFTPSGPDGNKPGVLRLTNSNGTTDVTLKGKQEPDAPPPPGAEISIAPDPVDFGMNLPMFTFSSNKTVTVTKSSGANIKVQTISVSNPDIFSQTGTDGCTGTTLTNGSPTCTFELRAFGQTAGDQRAP